jgi:hypothetical protein
MKPEKVEGKAAKAHQRPLHKLVSKLTGEKFDKGYEIPFETTFEAYETIDEIKQANDMPSDSEVVAYRNTQRRNNARTIRMNEVIAEQVVKPSLDEDVEMQLTLIYTGLRGAKKSHEEAKSMAAANLGLDGWPEDVDEPSYTPKK